MFLLSETELTNNTPLKNISRINISFYTSRNEYLNIFNLESDFDENLIPLITSTLECKPILISRKTYIGLDTNYIIEYPISCNSNLENLLDENVSNNNTSRFPSFHIDIDTFNKNTTKHNSYWQSRKIQYTNIYPKSNELVRVYSKDTAHCNIFNPQDTLGCQEDIVIFWPINGICEISQYGKFELCISSSKQNNAIKTINTDKDNNKAHSHKCIWRMEVNVIEEHKFIDSKVDAVNTWLEKIHKIKSTLKIANQELL